MVIQNINGINAMSQVAKASVSNNTSSGGASMFSNILQETIQAKELNNPNQQAAMNSIMALQGLKDGMNASKVSTLVAQAYGDTINDPIRKSRKKESLADRLSSVKATPVDQVPHVSINQDDETLVAQLLETESDTMPAEYIISPDDEQNLDIRGLEDEAMTVSPFQLFIDKAMDFFESISAMEKRTDWLMEQYTLGKASIEELTIEKTKVGVALSFAVTIVNQVTQAFNEIKNMQV